MRVTIEHREERSGLTGGKRDYFVDCTVHFSDEERAIVEQRRLQKTEIPTGLIGKPPSARVGADTFRELALPLGAIAFIAGLVLMYGVGAEAAGGLLILLALFGAPAAWVYGWFRTFVPKATLKDSLTVGELMRQPTFSLHATDPVEAKVLDEEIREQLTKLKRYISLSADIGEKQTFDL